MHTHPNFMTMKITMHDNAGTTGHATPTSDATSWMSACHNAHPTPNNTGHRVHFMLDAMLAIDCNQGRVGHYGLWVYPTLP